MKNIISLLSLDPKATEEEIVTTLRQRFAAHDEATAEIERLRALTKSGGLPKSITPELLQGKLDAGLDKGKALDVLLAQAEHDKTKPHDPAPKLAAK